MKSLLLYFVAAAVAKDASLIQQFDRCRVANEAFKLAVEKKASDWKAKRDVAAKRCENNPELKTEKWLSKLSETKDQKLMTSFVKMLASLENSADEQQSMDFATIFSKNADLVEKAFAENDAKTRTSLKNRLEFGWDNLFYQKTLTPEQKQLKQRLDALK